MERRYFKLEHGYLNVDERAIVFTRSGNWAEAEAAGELVTAGKVKHAGRVVIGVGLMAIAVLFLFMHSGSLGWLIGLAGLLIGGSKFLGPFQSEMGRTFRVPFNKVQSLTYDNGKLTVEFLNGHWKQDSTTVELPDEAATWIKEMWNTARAN